MRIASRPLVLALAALAVVGCNTGSRRSTKSTSSAAGATSGTSAVPSGGTGAIGSGVGTGPVTSAATGSGGTGGTGTGGTGTGGTGGTGTGGTGGTGTGGTGTGGTGGTGGSGGGISYVPKPVARFVYAAQLLNPATGTQPPVIQAFSLDAATGALTRVGAPVVAPTNPLRLRVHPNGRFLFALGNIAGEVWCYLIDPQTGTLSQVATARANGAAPVLEGLVVHPSGRFLFSSDLSGAIYGWSVDAQNGALAPLPGSPWATAGGKLMDGDAQGKFLYTSDVNGVIQAWPVDPTTGAVGTTSAGSVAAYDTVVMIPDPLGRYLHTLSGAGGAYGMGLAYSWRADATAGISFTQLLNWTDTGFSPSGGSVHPAGARLYTCHLQGSLPPGSPVTNPFGGAYGPDTVWWYEVPAGGTLSVRGGVAADHGATGIEAEQGGKWLLVSCQTTTVNDGNVTVIGLDAFGDPTGVAFRATGLGMPVAVASAP